MARSSFSPVRRLTKLAIETVAANWIYQHRKEILAKVSRRKPALPDTTRPVGDRAVAMVPDRGPTPFEAAVATEAPPLTTKVVENERHANDQVRIDGSPVQP